MTTEEKLLQEIAKRLDKIETAISTGGGGLPIGAATETTLSSIDTKVATETTLQNVATALSALKDGEFRVLSDPNDNDRLVGLTADMTNPAAPIYVYRYLDNNAAYAGDVNDLQAGTTAASTALMLYRKPQYYLIGNGINISATPSVVGNIIFGYNNGVIGGGTFDDGGALQAMGAFANFGALLTALNTAQTIFEFYEFTAPELARIGTNETVIGIRSNTSLVKEQWNNNLILTIDSTGFSAELQTLADNTTTQDVMLNELEKTTIATQASSNTLSTLQIYIVAIYTYLLSTFANYFRPTKAIIDGAGRWRTSEPLTIFNSKLIADAAPLLWDDQLVSGSGGSSTHFPNKACVTLAVGAAACSRIRQTFMRFNYQSAKSQLIEITGKLTTTGGSADIETGFGYGDEKNGIFVKHVNGILYLGLRSFVTGVAVDTWINSANWNEFTGINITPGYAQVLIIDFQWLGLGDVRVGFKIDDKIVYVHTFTNTNFRDTVFMSTPNLPVRYWITKTAGLQIDSMDCICSAVISEGGTEDIGVIRYTPTPVTALTVPLAGVIYMLRGFRLKTTHFSITNRFLNFTIVCSSTDDYEWMWIRNPAVADTYTFADEGISSCQTVEGQVLNIVTPGTGHILAGGVIKGGASLGAVAVDIPNILTLGVAIDGTPDEFYLCVRPLTAIASFYYGVERKEIL